MKKKWKLSIIVFAVEVVLFWIIWFINSYAWLNCIDMISDVLNIVLIVGMIIIIVSGFLIFIKLVNHASIDNYISVSKKIVSLSVLIIIIIIHSVMYISFSDMGYSTIGLINITDKKEIGDSYYFYVKKSGNNFVEIECTKKTYENLIVDKDVAYTMRYRWITYNDDKGVLENIDIKDFIDNRR